MCGARDRSITGLLTQVAPIRASSEVEYAQTFRCEDLANLLAKLKVDCLKLFGCMQNRSSNLPFFLAPCIIFPPNGSSVTQPKKKRKVEEMRKDSDWVIFLSKCKFSYWIIHLFTYINDKKMSIPSFKYLSFLRSNDQNSDCSYT